MISSKQKHLTARLLSGSRKLSVPEKEVMLNALLGGVRKESRYSRKRVVGVAVGVAAATLVLGLWVWGWRSAPANDVKQISASPEFAVRGNGMAVSYLAARCNGGNGRQCVLGGKMAYKVRPPQNKPYLAAFMKHQVSGTVVWLFPNDSNGSSIRVTAAAESEVLSQGTYLDAAFEAGQYILYGVYTGAPCSRTEIKNLIANRHGENPHVVVTKSSVTIEDLQ